MSRWTVVFLAVALIAGLFGFLQLEGTATWIAVVLFVVFLVLFVASLVIGRKRSGKPALTRGGQKTPDQSPSKD